MISCSSTAAFVFFSLRHQHYSIRYMRRRGEHVDKRPLLCSLSPHTWSHISVPTLIILFNEKLSSSDAALIPEPSLAIAGRCRSSLPLIITAGDTWLFIAPCCCNRDGPGYQGDWEEHTFVEKKCMESRGLLKAIDCLSDCIKDIRSSPE